MEYSFLIYQLKGHIKTTELEGFSCCRKEQNSLNVTWQALQYYRNLMGRRCINSVKEYNSIHHELQVATYRN